MLVVDDADDIRRLFTTLLGLAPDFDVVGEAANGLEAIETARELQPDVILLDIQMPVMDGITALPLIRDVAPNSKVIFLTALDTRLVEDLPEAHQGDGIVPKAILPSKLYETLRALDRHPTKEKP
jgi:CheY-like chemotaxis protein